jgi:hypothetical protein
MNNVLRRGVFLLEYTIVLIATFCFGSYILMTMLGGVNDFLGSTEVLYNPLNLIIGIIRLVFQITSAIITKLHNATIVYIAHQIYIHGPSIHGWGFWQGKDVNEICGTITGTSSQHWAKNLDVCNKLIDTEVQSLVIGAQIVISIFLTFKYVDYFWERYCKNTKRTSHVKKLWTLKKPSATCC